MVPREIIDEIRNRVDIVRLISDVTPLKKSGRNYTGLCPFHEEKSPSFTVSEQKQLYHCFGCGAGGTAYTFLMNYHHLTFPEALDRLATRAGVDLSRFSEEKEAMVARRAEKRRLLEIVAYARDVYHRAFLESESAKESRRYAASRGITSPTARRIKLGFAPEGWDTLVRAIKRDGRSLEDAVRAGLIAPRKGGEGYYDLFRSRLLFPIENASGETVGFGGRALGEVTPKYLNSPQSALFDKGKLLFGLHVADEAIRKAKKVVVVEGYMDQVALVEAGIGYAVATLGTALTESHARLLKQYAEEVILVFDGDEAGRKASRRSARPLLAEGVRAQVVELPLKHDPDTFVREKGKEAFEALLAQAKPLLTYFVERFYRGERDVTKKAEAMQELAEVIRSAPTPYLQEALLEEACRETGLEKAVLRGEKRYAPVAAPTAREMRAPEFLPEEFLLLRILAEVPEARVKFSSEQGLPLFRDERRQEIVREWVVRLEGTLAGGTDAASAVDLWEDAATRPLLAKALLDDHAPVSGQWERVWGDCERRLRSREMKRLPEEIRAAEAVGDEERIELLQRRLQELKTDSGRASKDASGRV